MLVTTIDAQWEGMLDVGSGRYEPALGPTSPMPDHKGFKLQQLVNFQKFSTVRVTYTEHMCKRATIRVNHYSVMVDK